MNQHTGIVSKAEKTAEVKILKSVVHWKSVKNIKKATICRETVGHEAQQEPGLDPIAQGKPLDFILSAT